MSGGEAIDKKKAFEAADAFISLLKRDKVVSRAEIAGSLRREKPEVHDIEIVCEPILKTGETVTLDGVVPNGKATNMLHKKMNEMFMDGEIDIDRPRKDDKKNPFGPKYYRIYFWYNGWRYPIDLFVVIPPAQWGVIFLIRTGSADFSKWFVQQGYRYGIKVVNGHLEQNGKILQTPEEIDVFTNMRVPYLRPSDREK